jgi:hypothetical protein
MARASPAGSILSNHGARWFVENAQPGPREALGSPYSPFGARQFHSPSGGLLMALYGLPRSGRPSSIDSYRPASDG